jgi:hypothetical protein
MIYEKYEITFQMEIKRGAESSGTSEDIWKLLEMTTFCSRGVGKNDLFLFRVIPESMNFRRIEKKVI